jgi:Tol biopolymer transport system component
MVTGRKAFEGASQASVIAAIMERDPPHLSAAQPLAPPALDHVVATCLEKDPDDRWQTARDVLHELQWVAAAGATAAPHASGVAASRRSMSWLIAAAVASAAVTALGMTLWRGNPPTPIRDIRFSVYPESGSLFSPASASVVSPQFAISRDGSSLAFVATSDGRDKLWVRRLDGLAARVLAGTDDAIYPFWSPDGRSLGFFAQGKLKIATLGGGPAVIVTDASFDPRGGAWAPDGTMLVSLVSNGGLSRVFADGKSELVGPLDVATGETGLRWPFWLPDSRRFLAVSRNTEDSRRGIYLRSLDNTSSSFLVSSDWGPAFVDGRLLFLRGPTLMAQAFDLGEGRLTGEPEALLDGIGALTNGYSAFSVSSTGTLAYSGPWATKGELVWFDRDGRQMGGPIAPLADYVDFSLSPDSSRVAMSRVDPQTNTADIWLLDLARNKVETRLTSDRLNDAGAMWSPDASRLYFRSNRRGINSLYVKPANGSRPEELVFDQGGEVASSMISSSLSRDGSRLLFSAFGLRSSFDVWELSLAPVPQPTAVLQSAFNEYQAAFSPDGRWIAFVSNETGSPQVYVQAYPGGDPRQQVSSRGGSDPRWRADGRELFFIGEDRLLMAAPFSTGSAGVPVTLFRTRVPISGNPYRLPYAPSDDGQRFLVNTAPVDTPPPAIQVVLDWRALLPAERR